MQVIAYYLPQFHEIPENNEWWGKGHTEWTSVRAARAYFRGHNQPVEPGELGYYNLLDPAVRERQAQLAKEAGVLGFCYWHYWFGGKRLLERPFDEVLASGTPDLPFCLGWANESWKAKTWRDQNDQPDRMLIEQTYSEEDNRLHFAHLMNAFRDSRYIRVDDKPLLLVYRPKQLPNGAEWVERWRQMAKEADLPGLYLVGHCLYQHEADEILAMGFDAVNIVPIGDTKRDWRLMVRHPKQLFLHLIGRCPLAYRYRPAIRAFAQRIMRREEVIPTLLPNWDHSPRSHERGFLLYGSTPELFGEHVDAIKALVEEKKHPLVFLKSWNEWGEGNYIEPDARWGKRYLEELSKRIAKK